MTSAMRYRYGDTRPVVLPVDASTVIETGDLIWMDTDDAKPASAQADQGTKAFNQEAFHDRFVGVAMQQSLSGTADAIRIATSGAFELVCDSGTFELGELIGVEEASSGTALENQKVAGVANEYRAIGRCARRVGSADTKVLIDLQSTVMRGGPQAAA